MADFHKPVMLSEVVEFLQPGPGQTIVDCTLGGGGDALELVKRVLPNGRLIGIDRDEDALQAAADYLSGYADNVILEKANFSDITAVAERLGIESMDGVLMDLGTSSHQLESDRGFSFRRDDPLSMLMDRSDGITAEEVVNSMSEKQLADLIYKYGEERWAKRIAEFIVDRRAHNRIRTTGELVEAILAAIPSGARGHSIHPATRTFQAIRIYVNRELESLQAGLDGAISLLASGGRICILSYHSLEDRICKETFARYSGRCTCPPQLPVCACGSEKVLRVLTKRPVVASTSEVYANPRARSAKLRAAVKI